MTKKFLLTTAFSVAMLAGTAMVSAEPAQNPADEPVVAVLADGQEAVESDAVNSEEVNTIEVSRTARKMTQEEKARNAAENDSTGGAITIIAMCIVLSALIVLSILFLCFGKISSAFLSKKKREAHGLSKKDAPSDKELLDSGETIAAIATALAEHFSKDHDLEDSILTIRRMRRAYSPWNSKIYNMRQVPELKRHSRTM